MARSSLSRVAGLGLLCLMLLPGLAEPAGAEQLRWETRLGFPQSLPIVGEAAQSLQQRVARLSDGRLELVLQGPTDDAAKAPVSAASEGRVAAAFTWIGREPGRASAAQLFDAVPFGLEPSVFMAWYYEGPGHDLLQEVLANQGLAVHGQLCGLAGPESAGWFASEVNEASDLKAMTGRFGGLGGEVLHRLGMALSDMPPDEIKAAVASGRLQATEMALPAIDVHTGIHETLPYNLYPGWQQPFTAVYLLVNGNRWRALGPAMQARVRTACEAVTARSLARSEATQGEAVETLRASGATLQRLPADVLSALREATETVLAAHAERNPEFRRILESQRAFADKHARAARLMR